MATVEIKSVMLASEVVRVSGLVDGVEACGEISISALDSLANDQERQMAVARALLAASAIDLTHLSGVVELERATSPARCPSRDRLGELDSRAAPIVEPPVPQNTLSRVLSLGKRPTQV